jgi:hypothetical protein
MAELDWNFENMKHYLASLTCQFLEKPNRHLVLPYNIWKNIYKSYNAAISEERL